MYTIITEITANFFDSRKENTNDTTSSGMNYKRNGSTDEKTYHIDTKTTQVDKEESIASSVLQHLNNYGIDPTNSYLNDNSIEFDDVITAQLIEGEEPEQEYAVTYKVTIEDSNGEELSDETLSNLFPQSI
ncbi:hypothetical protein [Bacillus sp. Marseille-P3800]|uniref:hypothetical protein n=1 Tax=Bacillus sp. Marseille-P3800 TaxID=2014782 RepID=UPI000C06896B|nr:hypothetical protein [Bacillus sp. Marseille-P3800]